MTRRPYHPRGELVEGYRVRDHPLYTTHAQMIARCTNPSSASFKNYGARGISVCAKWQDFRNFVADMSPRPSAQHTIERVDNDGNYEPSNCVWATRTEQCLNRRKFTSNTSGFTGVTLTCSGWNARYDMRGERYCIGWFSTAEDAAHAREAFVSMLAIDRKAALTMLNDRVRSNSSSGHRGITPCEGGFIARCTIDGERQYIGYFKRIEDAVRAREKFIAGRKGKIAGRVARRRDKSGELQNSK